MLIHGTSDSIVPFHHSEALYKAIPEQLRAEPLYIEGMSHNNVHLEVRPMFVQKLSQFLSKEIEPSIVRPKTRTRLWQLMHPTTLNQDHSDDEQ